MQFSLGPRRATYTDIERESIPGVVTHNKAELKHFEDLDLLYRTLCALLYNYVPTSGHPGGSISCGRFVAGLLFGSMDYDPSDPDRIDADIISFAAGHKAMGLYAMWAIRNEIMRIAAPELLPQDVTRQFRIEDLLGFRRSPITRTPLFLKFKSKPLDGHPTPATPFVRLSTGASGVGITSSLGLAFGAIDYYREKAPRVHIIEGEGGMTPGRVSEAMAAAGTASLNNVVLHIDWNQASIDSDHVCREGELPGDYVQWDPVELAYIHDWNVILVPDGKDFQQVFTAQQKALKMENSQPTMIAYRTTKGWKYGIEGKKAHGVGHKLCADGFFKALEPFLEITGSSLPKCESANQRCEAGKESDVLEECFWESLLVIRSAMEGPYHTMTEYMAQKLRDGQTRLNRNKRQPRIDAPNVSTVFALASRSQEAIPEELMIAPGTITTLRGELGRVLHRYNKAGKGALLSASADLLGSTSVNMVAEGFSTGYYNALTNPDARILSIGGICEDAMSGVLAGVSTFGHHLGVVSSYGAFIAPLAHVSARLHAIGNQARRDFTGEPYRPMILICAHAGVKTGEDGPTHADPQPLQLFQENFPLGTMITLTPWDPLEMWPLVSAALARRPAIIAPFVTRPNERILDRQVLNLAPATEARHGMYLLRRAESKADGTVVLQGSEVAYSFIEQVLPLLAREGIDLDVYYATSAELFDLLPQEEQERIYPLAAAQEALGITGFTLPTMYRWIQSERGRKMTLHPFQNGRYLGSGQADKVMEEAGLDGESQFKAIVRYVKGAG